MVFRCTSAFVTHEDGYPVTIDEGSVWMASRLVPRRGGYEVVLMERLVDGTTADQAVVRLARLSDSFEQVPPGEIAVPPVCSTFHGLG